MQNKQGSKGPRHLGALWHNSRFSRRAFGPALILAPVRVNAEVNWPNSAILTRSFSIRNHPFAVPDIAQARIKIISFLEHDPPAEKRRAA